MRLFTGLLLLLLASSCSSSEEKKLTVSDQIKVSLDTVMIDAGQEFLYLQDQLYSSSLSEDKSYLINFNRKDNSAEKIDLDNLQLDRKIQFEKEGPNGIGNYPQFSILPNQQILFWNYQFYKILDQNGELVRDLELEKIAEEYLGVNEYFARSLQQHENNPDRFIALVTHWQSNTEFILDFDLENRTYQKIDLPDWAKNIERYIKILYDGNDAGGYGTGAFPLLANGNFLISSNAFNEVQVFDFKGDSVQVKKWDTPLLGYEKEYVPPKTVEYTTGGIKDVERKLGEEISYGSFFWDDKNQRFLRFSDKKSYSEELNEYNSYVSTGADVFLSIFDKDLNLIAEAQIPELTQTPNVHFAKDGNIWIFENIDDEMAFVIVEIEMM
ncbi:DUF4221 family protein [Algoriphagus winogradskyi]|uniref:TolB-like 6-blade propeller-like n=1 Tax=Algoriphagus winogradskyi TaxID=237017 RepID=A0ABY1P563_9BACT|nr:DUF4221 family protein [Algoriphagus winogradskyi]SMP24411.1 protein of unknown function [Algoriphagus winogradskyi]